MENLFPVKTIVNFKPCIGQRYVAVALNERILMFVEFSHPPKNTPKNCKRYLVSNNVISSLMICSFIVMVFVSKFAANVDVRDSFPIAVLQD